MLTERIENKSAVVAVFGMGYVGLPLALEIAKSGFKILGADINEKKISVLNSGKNPMTDLSEINEEELLELVLQEKIEFTNNSTASEKSDIKIICVPTPVSDTKEPALHHLRNASKFIGNHLKKEDLVINESTVAPGMTNDIVGNVLENASGLKKGDDFYLVASPERIDPGNLKFTLNRIPKIVGGINEKSAIQAKHFYSNFVEKVHVVSSMETAELSKIVENSFRALNIGFVNEIADYCHKRNIDVLEVINAASTKPFAFLPHYPGLGVGGHCIAVDPYYLISEGKQVDAEFKILRSAMETNEFMVQKMMSLIKNYCFEKKLTPTNTTIALLGISYKGNIKDIRESPALKFLRLAELEGFNLRVHDPFFTDQELTDLGLVPLNIENGSADLAVIGCEHEDFKTFPYIKLKGIMAIFDGKNVVTQKQHVPILGIGRFLRE